MMGVSNCYAGQVWSVDAVTDSKVESGVRLWKVSTRQHTPANTTHFPLVFFLENDHSCLKCFVVCHKPSPIEQCKR